MDELEGALDTGKIVVISLCNHVVLRTGKKLGVETCGFAQKVTWLLQISFLRLSTEP